MKATKIRHVNADRKSDASERMEKGYHVLAIR